MIILLRQTSYARFAKNLIENFAKNIPFTPNQITISSIFLALLAFFAIYSNQLFVGLFLFLVSGLFDALDGAVARTKKQKTNFGFFLDGVSDRIVEFLFIASFLFLPFPGIPKEPTLFALLFFSMIIPYVKSYADHSKTLSHEAALKMGGIFERSERLIFFYIILISTILGFEILSNYLLLLAAFLSFITFIQRFNYAKQFAKKI